MNVFDDNFVENMKYQYVNFIEYGLPHMLNQRGERAKFNNVMPFCAQLLIENKPPMLLDFDLSIASDAVNCAEVSNVVFAVKCLREMLGNDVISIMLLIPISPNITEANDHHYLLYCCAVDRNNSRWLNCDLINYDRGNVRVIRNVTALNFEKNYFQIDNICDLFAPIDGDVCGLNRKRGYMNALRSHVDNYLQYCRLQMN